MRCHRDRDFWRENSDFTEAQEIEFPEFPVIERQKSAGNLSILFLYYLYFNLFYLLRDVLRARAFHFNPKSRAFTSLGLNSSGMLETLLNDPTEERNFLMTKSWRFSREWLRKRWNDRDLEGDPPVPPFLLEAFKFQQDWLRPTTFNFTLKKGKNGTKRIQFQLLARN